MWVKIAIAFITVALVIGIAEIGDGKGLCGADPSFDTEEQKFLVLINQYRSDNGLQRILPSESLSTASQWKATDMSLNNYLAHDDLSGRTFVERLRDCGYHYNTFLGENLAVGSSTAQGVFRQWQNSPGHNSIMLGENYRAIGIGHKGVRWVTDFGGVVETGSAPLPPMPTAVPPPTPKPQPTPPPVVVPSPTHDPCGQ